MRGCITSPLSCAFYKLNLRNYALGRIPNKCQRTMYSDVQVTVCSFCFQVEHILHLVYVSLLLFMLFQNNEDLAYSVQR